MSKICNSCNSNDMAVMPIAQHEKDQQRLMSIIKKQFIAIIVLICLLFGSFGLFVWYESQYETITYDYEQDGEGTNIIGDSNEVNNGAEIETESEEEIEE
jgi:hypothetical protein